VDAATYENGCNNEKYTRKNPNERSNIHDLAFLDHAFDDENSHLQT
jgi:hypothetical protein